MTLYYIVLFKAMIIRHGTSQVNLLNQRNLVYLFVYFEQVFLQAKFQIPCYLSPILFSYFFFSSWLNDCHLDLILLFNFIVH